MRIEDVRIALRPRTAWEAVDLGLRLVRENARAIWVPWLIASLPLLLVLNALAWWSGHPWLAFFAMWWLKPVFGRIPLIVLSRAVFAPAPDWRETLRIFRGEGWRAMWPVLLWRRLDPFRSLHLPIDQLEGMDRAGRSARRRLLRRSASSQALSLTTMGLLFVLSLYTSAWLVRLLFVSSDSLGGLGEVIKSIFLSLGATFDGTIAIWVLIVTNVLWWLAETVVEPFYIGGGFGLYLNRRIHIEAWDLELRFRRLAARLRDSARFAVSAMLVAVSLAIGALSPGTAIAAAPEQAAEVRPSDATAPTPATPTTLDAVFGKQHRTGDERFGRAVDAAFHEPNLGERKTVTEWRFKGKFDNPDKPEPRPAWLEAVGQLIGLVGEYGLWLIAAVLVVIVLLNIGRWLPWVGARVARNRATPIEENPLAVTTPLPDDVARTVRELWQDGRRREALALLYRACVAGLVLRLGTPLPPGTTEAQCLRRARALNDADSEQGLRDIVRAWQLAAYAGRWPDDAGLDALLARWSQHFAVRR